MFTKSRMAEEIRLGNVWFGRDGKGVPRLKQFLGAANRGINPDTLWLAHDVGTTDLAKKHLLRMFPRGTPFDTPKPESLIARLLHIASAPGELILDAYLGSGTTAAVAHKMNRKYIAIDENPAAISISAARLAKVVEGEEGGISKDVSWKGGSGFDLFRLR